MVMRGQFSHRAATESLPLRVPSRCCSSSRSACCSGPHILLEKPLHVVGVLAIIMFGKSLAALALVLVLRYPLNTALTVSASLARSASSPFILAGLGLSLDCCRQTA